MESPSVVIEKCEADIPNVPENPSEWLKGSGGVSLVGGNESGFKVVGAFIGKCMKKMAQGKFNFSSFQRPSLISFPKSHTQLMAEEFANLSKYILEAAKEKDPIERLQLVTAGVISNLALNVAKMKGKGPLNPLLGESFSAILGNGTKIYVEQISMHPHTTLMHIIGPDDLFTIGASVKVMFRIFIFNPL